MTTTVRNQLNGPYRELSKRILDGSGATLDDVISEHEEFYQTLENRILDVEDKLALLAPSAHPINHPLPTAHSHTRSI